MPTEAERWSGLGISYLFLFAKLEFFGAPYGSKSHWLDVVVFEVTGFVTIYGIFHIVFRVSFHKCNYKDLDLSSPIAFSALWGKGIGGKVFHSACLELAA